MGEGTAVDVVYLDFSKAFVMVSHRILIVKLVKYGLDKWTDYKMVQPIFCLLGSKGCIAQYKIQLSAGYYWHSLGSTLSGSSKVQLLPKGQGARSQAQ